MTVGDYADGTQAPIGYDAEVSGRLNSRAGACNRAEFRTRRERLKVVALAWLGLLAVPVAALVLIALPTGVIALGIWTDSLPTRIIGLSILIINGVAAFSMVRAAWFRVPAIKGLECHRASVPELFQVTDLVARQLAAPAVDRVFLTGEMNAAIRQQPRWGGLGGYTNELTIGLPLLQSVDPHEFAAVIGHEFAHLRDADGKVGTLVFKTRTLWQRMEAVVANEQFLGRGTLARFAAWYVPRFDRVSREISRANEFAADLAAVRSVAPAHIAAALVRVKLAAAYHDELWEAYWSHNVRHDKPAEGFFSYLDRHLPQLTEWSEVEKVLNRAVSETAGFDDTHPTLRERLIALGVAPGLPGAVTDPATCLLGRFREVATEKLNEAWWAEHQAEWQSYYAGLGPQRQRFEQLEENGRQRSLSLEDAVERAARAEYLLGADAAIDRLGMCIAQFPYEVAGYYNLGCLFLRLGDEKGIKVLVHAMALDESAIPAATDRIIGYLAGVGDKIRTLAFKAKADAWLAGNPEWSKNPDMPIPGEILLRLPLEPDMRAGLHDVLEKLAGIRSVYLVQRRLRPWDESTRAHLIVEPSGHGFRGRDPKRLGERIKEEIAELEIPFGFHLWVLQESGHHLIGQARQTDAALFSRPSNRRPQLVQSREA